MRGSPRRGRLRVTAPAKLNLGLWVGPRRPDGYHEIATIYQSISLADTLVLEPRARGFELEVRHENVAARGTSGKDARRLVPPGRGNLVLRAAQLFASRAGLRGGARIRLVKRIPAGAGLGGGSADAAATLVGLRALHRTGTSRTELLELAASLGSDVPFALVGGTALGTGRGERLRPMELARPLRLILAVPAWRISTARAYAAIDRRKYSLTAWGAKLRSTQILGRKRLSITSVESLGNSFEEALGRMRPSFLSLRDRLTAAGATNVRMTGSGSAVFGWLEPGTSARNVVERFAGGEALFVVQTRRTGVRIAALP